VKKNSVPGDHNAGMILCVLWQDSAFRRDTPMPPTIFQV
jgi:hypothetical protein